MQQTTYLSHGICFVQYEQLEWRARVSRHWLAHRGRSKCFDLLPHNIDAPLITGIQLLYSCLSSSGLHQVKYTVTALEGLKAI